MLWLNLLPTIAIAIFTYLYWKESRRQANETKVLAMLQFITTIVAFERNVSADLRAGKHDDALFLETTKKILHDVFPDKSKELSDLLDSVHKSAKEKI